MKCPFRVNIDYPARENENKAYQNWADCDPECQFYKDDDCIRVQKTIAQKTFYELVIENWDELMEI